MLCAWYQKLKPHVLYSVVPQSNILKIKCPLLLPLARSPRFWVSGNPSEPMAKKVAKLHEQSSQVWQLRARMDLHPTYFLLDQGMGAATGTFMREYAGA